MDRAVIFQEALEVITKTLEAVYEAGLSKGLSTGEELYGEAILIEQHGAYFPIAEDVKEKLRASILRDLETGEEKAY